MKITIPEYSLVLLIGKESLKEGFIKEYLENKPLINEDEKGKVEVNLKDNQLTFVDIKDIKYVKGFINLAKKYHRLSVGILFGVEVDERFNLAYQVQSIDEIDIYFSRLRNNLKHKKGPFDIIGDVHGCYDELMIMLDKLGYIINVKDNDYEVINPKGRTLVFVGDLVDRGPKIVDVLKLVMHMVDKKQALCVAGNHDNKLMRYLKGRNVKVQHGLETSVEQLEACSDAFIERVKTFLNRLETHYILDNGKLVIAHAGIKEKYQGGVGKTIQAFTLYGETTGETDEFDLPIRKIWAKDYEGDALVIYGHTPNLEVFELNHTFNIDTGCVFGNKLTAYKYPEHEFVYVDALENYSKPSRPLGSYSE